MKILIIGNGYIGQRCAAAWPGAVLSSKYINNKQDVLNLIAEHNPDAILNAAGVVGKPNVDWCETHQLETIAGNTILPIIIAEAAQEKNIYLLHIGTGCVYYGYAKDKKGWIESDPGNPLAVYTRAKYAVDLVLSTLPNVGIARIRMPLDSIPSPANLINKLASFKTVIDVVNSLTVVEDMIDVFYKLMKKKATGIFHVTNPGAIKHKEILAMYKKIVCPTHTNEWIKEENLLKSGLAQKKRSNNILQSPNLAKLGITMRPVKVAVKDALIKYAKYKKP